MLNQNKKNHTNKTQKYDLSKSYLFKFYAEEEYKMKITKKFYCCNGLKVFASTSIIKTEN